MRLRLVFCSPSENTVKNGAVQLPFSSSHLADSCPYQGSVSTRLDSQKKNQNQFNTKEIPIFCLFHIPQSAYGRVKLKMFYIKKIIET